MPENSTIACDDIYGFFEDCESLESLDLHNFDTYDTNDMSGMFYNCKRIKELDLSNFHNRSSVQTALMFAGCDSLESLDIRNLNLNKINTYDMFGTCACKNIYPLSILEKVEEQISSLDEECARSFIEYVFNNYLDC